MHVSGLAIYPVKSMRRRVVDRLRLTSMGPQGDRRWMVVDDNGKMLTQRQLPRMALIDAQPQADALTLQAPGMQTIWVCRPIESELTVVQVWEDVVKAIDGGDEVAEWLGEWLGRKVRLVFMPESTRRQVDLRYADAGMMTAFSDGFPLLLASQDSLADLNRHMSRPVDMVRFRPNLVVSGASAWAEDGWRLLQIGAVRLRVVKPCSRCVIPSIDPASGNKDHEVIDVLKTHRSRDNKTWFGQNVLVEPESIGQVLQVGDAVRVLE